MGSDVTHEEQVAEAVKRMRSVRLHRNVISEFKSEGKLNLSECGILYWLDPSQQEYVEAFEKESGCVVYHVIHDMTSIGELLTMLFVSPEVEEWERDEAELMAGTPFAYVENLSDPFCSEYGTVMVHPCIGGLVRTA